MTVLEMASEEQLRVLRAYIEHGSHRAAAEALGITEQRSRHVMHELYLATGFRNIAEASYALAQRDLQQRENAA